MQRSVPALIKGKGAAKLLEELVDGCSGAADGGSARGEDAGVRDRDARPEVAAALAGVGEEEEVLADRKGKSEVVGTRQRTNEGLRRYRNQSSAWVLCR